ncbi:LPXTG cell wall anchor domain-containing protein [Nocardioides rotundus]|nr:LPXTG cell wall anchor domain-containing protein [Nocardioides rotundus]
MTCTAPPYTVTAQDAADGSVRNRAELITTPPVGDPCEPGENGCDVVITDINILPAEGEDDPTTPPPGDPGTPDQPGDRPAGGGDDGDWNPLPNTGGPALWVALLGLALLAGGGFLVRRRRGEDT